MQPLQVKPNPPVIQPISILSFIFMHSFVYLLLRIFNHLPASQVFDAGVKQTSPGKDEICYEMIKHLSDESLGMVLNLFNKIWETGIMPVDWKHGVIVPIEISGKDHSKASNYRPIALTSNLCKLMERMFMNRLIFVIESRNIFSAYQSGFRKGRSTMDSIVYLENEIRKAQIKKEVLVGVFF